MNEKISRHIHTYLHVFFSKITMRNLILKIAISTFTTLVGSCFSIILINDIRHRAYGAGGAWGCLGDPMAPPCPPPILADQLTLSQPG